MGQAFLDEATIHVEAGKGGDGRAHFLREKFVPFGGPDGGDGGRGGDVILQADHNVASLGKFRSHLHFKAEDGEMGGTAQCSGRAASNLIITVPVGTQIRNTRGELIADLLQNSQQFVAAQGGRGGLGNQHFKSSTNRTPSKATLGKPGQSLDLHLELALVGDVGLVGFPNAGKSTLLAAITDARPKIADYPFTTLAPNQGICDLDENRSLLIADIPGLIEGASQGIGLGLQFLKHVRRTSVLLFLLDASEADDEIVRQYRVLQAELKAFDPGLSRKRRVIALSKCDTLPADERLPRAAQLREALKLPKTTPIVPISSIARWNLQELLEDLWAIHARARQQHSRKTAVSWSPLHG